MTWPLSSAMAESSLVFCEGTVSSPAAALASSPAATPTGKRAGRLKRKYKKLHQQRHSPLSCVARRLILRKCKSATFVQSPSLVGRGTSSVMSEVDALTQRLQENFSCLHVEKFRDKNGEGWMVVSRYVSDLNF